MKRLCLSVLLSWCALGLAGGAPACFAQNASGGSADSSAAIVPADSLSAPAGGPSARDYLAEVYANYTDENRAYSDTQLLLAFAGPLYGLIVGLLILFSKLSARMRDVAERIGRRRYFSVLIYLALYSIAAFVLGLPLSWYAGFVLEHQYGLSTEAFGAWFGDELKGVGLGIVFFGVIPIVTLAYAAIRRSRRWWMWLGAGSIPVIVISVLIQPIVIDPLFNEFRPLEDQALKQRVLALAEETGIPGRNVYQVDKSTETKKLNAYVNGFGASQRVVFWDTILQAMDEDELVFVAGHEMGHYTLGHIWKLIIFLSIMSFALFFISGKLMQWATARFGSWWGFTELHDIASLPLLAIAISVASFVAQPLTNAVSRYVEREADIYALEATHLNEPGARAFLKLGQQNKSNPDPPAIQKIMFWSHPPLAERVQFMLEYRPWEDGKANRVFKPAGGGS